MRKWLKQGEKRAEDISKVCLATTLQPAQSVHKTRSGSKHATRSRKERKYISQENRDAALDEAAVRTCSPHTDSHRTSSDTPPTDFIHQTNGEMKTKNNENEEDKRERCVHRHICRRSNSAAASVLASVPILTDIIREAITNIHTRQTTRLLKPARKQRRRRRHAH